MKVTATKEHECYCCGATISKGDQCFALFVNSSNPKLDEFDVIYTCIKCVDKESCKTRIERRHGTST